MGKPIHPLAKDFVHLHGGTPVFSETVRRKVLAVRDHQLMLKEFFDIPVLFFFTRLLLIAS